MLLTLSDFVSVPLKKSDCSSPSGLIKSPGPIFIDPLLGVKPITLSSASSNKPGIIASFSPSKPKTSFPPPTLSIRVSKSFKLAFRLLYFDVSIACLSVRGLDGMLAFVASQFLLKFSRSPRMYFLRFCK